MDLFQPSEGPSLSDNRYGSVDAPLKVSELTASIKGSLEGQFSEVVLTGEVSNFKAHSSGHFYFSLKDEGASISTAMFRGSNSKLKFEPEDGMSVIAFGRISVFPPRGSYQMIVTRMEPEGVGALQLKFEKLKKKLQAEGYFEDARKRPIPKIPQRVGVVTSPTGAAIQDMLNIIDRRFSGLHVQIYPARVQGQGAAEEVAEGIRNLNKYFAKDLDVIIVTRGGGSMEDLWCFNEELVAREIFLSKIPVISAVGHEIDFTIADFVADLRAPTPSAAAELVSGNRVELMRQLENLCRRLAEVPRKLEERQLQYDDLIERMIRSVTNRVQNIELYLEKLRTRLYERSPQARLQEAKHQFAILQHKLKAISPLLLERAKNRVSNLEMRLRLLNPRGIMERGYSIVRLEKEQKVVTRASQVKLGDRLRIELHKGQIIAKI